MIQETSNMKSGAAVACSALLACPFCGCAAEMDTQQGYRNLSTGRIGSAVAIYCATCSAEISLCREDLPDFSADEIIEMVKERWNRRRPPRPWSPDVAREIMQANSVLGDTVAKTKGANNVDKTT